MPAVKHIEGLTTELDRSKYTSNEVEVDIDNKVILISFDKTKAYNLTDLNDYSSSFSIKLGEKDYSGTWEVTSANYSCSLGSNIVPMGTFSWLTDPPHVHYLHFVPTHNKMICYIHADEG